MPSAVNPFKIAARICIALEIITFQAAAKLFFYSYIAALPAAILTIDYG
jgi:hypothetical protein